MSSRSKKAGKHAYMRKIHGNLSRTIASLQNHLESLQVKEKFLRSEVLLHQAKLLAEENEAGEVFSSNSKFLLKQDHLETLRKQLKYTEMATSFEISNIHHEIEKVQIVSEESMQEEPSLLKSVHLQGNVGQFSFMLEGSMQQKLENRRGEVVDISKLKVNPLPDVVKQMLSSPKALEPSYVSRVLDNLHYLQMIQEERMETAHYLEDNVPDVHFDSESDPVVLQFSPTRELSIKLVWHIYFDARNMRFKNKMIIKCTSDVVAYFSRNEDVYPYLSTKEELQTSEDVISFFEGFLEF